MTDKKCIYCDETYTEDTEHVFPHGLGGEKVYMNCVCEKCNSEFSKLEGELFQNSPASLMRSVEGIKGYKKGNGNKAYFKAPILLTFDKENRIVYEISQHDKMEIILKSQFIETNSKYYLEGSNKKNINRFTKKLKTWKNNSFIAIIRVPSDSDNSFDYVKFSEVNNDIVYETLNTNEKEILRDSIYIQGFSKNHELFDNLSPRLYIDDNQKIKVRAKSVSEGLAFLHSFLRYTKDPKSFRSFSPTLNDNRVVYVGQSFLGDRIERAAVKITLNILLRYFPNIKTSPSIKQHIKFVKTGQPRIIVQIEDKNELMDSNEQTHNVFIHQFSDNVRLRLSLFNGHIIFTHLIPNLEILGHNEYYRFVNDYQNRKNRFENRNEMLKSFGDK